MLMRDKQPEAVTCSEEGLQGPYSEWAKHHSGNPDWLQLLMKLTARVKLRVAFM